MKAAIPGFDSLPVVCGISDRHIGHDDFLKSLGVIKARLARMQQVHAAKVVKVGARTDLSREIAEADAAITDVRGIALSVRTADCLPVLFYDPENEAIGAAHAGWRGTRERICPGVVGMMVSAFGTDPSKLVVGFGPALRQCCYEVNSEFLVHFPGSVVKMAHKHYFDMVGENAGQLISAGVSSKNIYDCGICTSCMNGDFFSYRREKDAAGRMLTVIMLK
jgi:hypothetical protein